MTEKKILPKPELPFKSKADRDEWLSVEREHYAWLENFMPKLAHYEKLELCKHFSPLIRRGPGEVVGYCKNPNCPKREIEWNLLYDHPCCPTGWDGEVCEYRED